MEGAPAQRNTILVSTINARVLFSTITYTGGVPNTGIFTSSNVVISNDDTNHVVIYATGTILLNGVSVSTMTTGPQGPKGDPGDPGGPAGPAGPSGAAATVEVGTTQTVSSNTAASVSNVGTSSAAVFNFSIPRGVDGLKGDTGATGATGAAGADAQGYLTDIEYSFLIMSTDKTTPYVLTVAKDGALVMASTTTTTTLLKFLSNSTYTSWMTATPADGVLRGDRTGISIKLVDLGLFDEDYVSWKISMDADGVFRSANSGGL